MFTFFGRNIEVYFVHKTRLMFRFRLKFHPVLFKPSNEMHTKFVNKHPDINK